MFLEISNSMDDSSLMYLFSAATALLLTICGIQFYRSGKNKKKLPPIAGTVFHQLLNWRRLHDYHTELCRKHKTFRLLASPFRNQIYITDPASVEHVLKTNFKNYGKGSFNYDILTDLLGDGIFVVDGEKWRHQRQLATYEFSTKASRDFSSSVFRRNAAKVARIISSKASYHEAVDIQDLFMKSTMDSTFEVGFGMELNSLQGSDEGSRFSTAFDNSNALTLFRYADPFWRIKKILRIGREAKLVGHINTVDEFIYKIIDARMKSSQNQRNDSVKKEDLLSRFIAEMERDPQNMTSKYLRDIILNFLIAGRDTSAGTMAWFIYMLCKDDSVQEKVAREVKEVTETHETTSFEKFANLLTDEDLNKMQYLHAALTETLRLYPAVPLEAKVCFSDDTLPDGFSTSKGDVVFYQPYAMGRMSYIWGEDAETFRPERWTNADGIFQPESPFKFTAFQAGPRICLGKDFAYRQMKTSAAVLLRFFKFKLSNQNEVVNYRTMITIPIDKGLHIHAFSRLM